MLMRTIRPVFAGVALAAIALTGCSAQDPVPAATAATASATSGPATADPAATSSATRAATSTRSMSRTSSPSAASAAGKDSRDPSKAIDPKTGLWDICRLPQGEFTGDAAKKFGKQDVMDAYCEMANFMLNNGFSDLMETKMHHRTVEFSFVKPWLSSPRQKELGRLWSPGPRSTRGTRTTRSRASSGWTSRAAGTSSRTATRAPSTRPSHPHSTWVDNDGRLAMRFTVGGDLIMRRTKDDKLVTLPFSRRVDFGLVRGPGGDKPWLIDGWTTKGKFGQYTPMGG